MNFNIYFEQKSDINQSIARNGVGRSQTCFYLVFSKTVTAEHCLNLLHPRNYIILTFYAS